MSAAEVFRQEKLPPIMTAINGVTSEIIIALVDSILA